MRFFGWGGKSYTWAESDEDVKGWQESADITTPPEPPLPHTSNRPTPHDEPPPYHPLPHYSPTLPTQPRALLGHPPTPLPYALTLPLPPPPRQEGVIIGLLTVRLNKKAHDVKLQKAHN